jgi:PAS domain S-box-containing protein
VNGVAGIVFLCLDDDLAAELGALLTGAGMDWRNAASAAEGAGDITVTADPRLLPLVGASPILLLDRAGDAAAPDMGIVLPYPAPASAVLSSLRALLRLQALAAGQAGLRESEARYRSVFDKMDDGFCVIEFVDGPHQEPSDYVLIEVNPAFERHAGRRDGVGQTVRTLVPEEAESWIERYGSVLRTGIPIRFEQKLVATQRTLELSAFRIEPPERRQVAVQFRDVTARRRAEARLRELNETLERRVRDAVSARRLLADIVEGTDAFVQAIDPSFRWLAVNRAAQVEFERIYGVRPEVGACVLDLLADWPDQRDAIRAAWARALAGEEFTHIGEFGDARRDRRWYEMKFNVLRDTGGAQVGAYQFVHDVTGRLRDQQRLEEATARMHEMAKQETLGQLTSGVAHDFNNLLTPIMGTLELLQQRVNGDARATRLIANALQAADRAATLVQRLLTFARRQDLSPRTVDIGALVDGMRDLIQRSLGPNIPVHVHVADGAPPARIDPNQLELALLNLAVNGRDAMAAGGVLAVEVKAAALTVASADGLLPGRYVCLSVRDTGAGMDLNTVKHAIEPFFTTKGQGKGTGLGLAMVHGLAVQSGGALRLLSRPGEGTTAEIWLPASSGAPETLPAPGGAFVPQPLRGRILLVDDEDLVRAATADMLREMGHAVIEAASGPAALARLRSGADIDLLVTDDLMPHMRGSTLVRDAQSIRPGLRALVITGATQASAEVADWPRLAKPFRETDLAREVARLLCAEPAC